MPKVEQPHTGASMKDWGDVLLKFGVNGELLHIDEGTEVKLAGLRTLEYLHLPRYKRVITPLADFLSDPERYFRRLPNSSVFYVNLISSIHGRGRIRDYGLKKDEVLLFIERSIKDHEVPDFTILLSQFFENQYGGSIIVNPNGTVIMEVVPGEHSPLCYGQKTPTIFGVTNPFTGTFGIYLDNEGVKRLNNPGTGEIMEGSPEHEACILEETLLHTLRCIPVDNDDASVRRGHHPGYYEFILVNSNGDGRTLSPLFLDYRSDPIYQTRPTYLTGSRQ